MVTVPTLATATTGAGSSLLSSKMPTACLWYCLLELYLADKPPHALENTSSQQDILKTSIAKKTKNTKKHVAGSLSSFEHLLLSTC